MKLKFKHQPYQVAAVQSVVDIFQGQPPASDAAMSYRLDPGNTKNGMGDLFAVDTGFKNAELILSEVALLDNIQQVQRQQNLPLSESLVKTKVARLNLDIEMETGTGKTYCYIKTIFELNKQYGWSKFVIVVPSIAIREGVTKSLEITAEHFQETYHKKARFFIYNSKQLHHLESFSSDAGINVMVINVQAFNATGKDNRRIYEALDDFQSRRPIDVISANRPILILDEPQRMEGGKTLDSLANFKPLMVLRYSATHKTTHNKIHRLDALDAYNQKLVKKIEVRGISVKGLAGTNAYLYLQAIEISNKKPPVAVVEFEQKLSGGNIKRVIRKLGKGDNLFVLSNELDQYRDGFVVSDINANTDTLGFTNGVELTVGDATGDVSEIALRRIQIRETIRAHFDKEMELFDKGVKVLSLFFIDEVARYRDYSAADEKGEYAKIFEEEYAKHLQEAFDNGFMQGDTPYAKYLRHIAADKTHSGYFSIDKKGNAVESKKEKASEAADGVGINDDDAKRGYDLILKDKERLLSLDEPVRFIFSHSALREGWDNPNIFQICTLKESGSETSKRQEVGRGMRLSVDQQGNRQDSALLGASEVHRVNLLTVIASESYETFVRDLQSDIKKNLRERPKKVEMDLFSSRDFVIEGQSVSFTPEESKRVYMELFKNDFIDKDDRPTEAFKTMVIDGYFVECLIEKLPREIADRAHALAVEALVKSVYDEHALDDMVGRAEEKVCDNALTDNFAKREFKELWERINHKHAYTVSFSDDELRRKAIARINTDLRVSRLQYTITTGSQKAEAKRDELAHGASFARGDTQTRNVDAGVAAVNVAYDLVGEVAQAAAITRRSAAAILAGIDANVFGQYRVNPEEFIKKAAQLIVSEKAAMIVEHISYHEIDGRYDEAIFTERMPDNASKAYEAKKNIQRYVFPDSEGERRFAEDLDCASEVAVYAKLPRTFQIPTPVGNYAPDWAIAFKQGSVRHVFFIAETKGTMDTLELSGVENAKIACAKKLFNEMSTSDVRYHNVATYDDLLEVMGRMS